MAQGKKEWLLWCNRTRNFGLSRKKLGCKERNRKEKEICIS